jgi:hypothetical protein
MMSSKISLIAGGRTTPTAVAIRKLGPSLHPQYRHQHRSTHTAMQTSAQLRESNDSIPALAAAVLGSEEKDLLKAAADALDPERTSASLGYTWLTHWQLVEEDRRFRQLIFQSIRGRQQQRQQQLFDLVGVEGASGASSSSTSSSDETVEAAAYRSDAEVRIVHGRLSVVSGSEKGVQSSFSSDEQRQPLSRSTTTEESDGIDDLTWLASHPEAEATEFSLNYNDTINSEGDATAAMSTVTSDSSTGSGGGRPSSWPVATPLVTINSTNDTNNTRQLQTGCDLETAAAAAVLPGAVQLQLGAEVATVRPLWISIYLEESTGTAKLFESVVPLQPEIVDKMSFDLTPFCSVSGLDFGALADVRYGPWLNYFVGLVGDVAVEEADILWPNQVLHRDRVLYNVRGADDVARFLADPRREDVEAHAENLKRLAEERGYRPGWVWYMLRSRWGQGVLKSMGIDPAKM